MPGKAFRAPRARLRRRPECFGEQLPGDPPAILEGI
ncbi:Uncharacterized protein pbN1_38510 [Aromatoleum bremense]|nr:Uncharacterized protein pbN1_38510 [Aromatoleum bremense]